MRQDAINGILKTAVGLVEPRISSRIEVRAHFRDLLFVSHVGHGTDCFAVTINSGISSLSLRVGVRMRVASLRARLKI